MHNLPYPISKVLQNLENETGDYFRKVHRLIDNFETIIKFHTAIIFSEFFKKQKIPEEIKGLLASGLKVPSLGIWGLFNRELGRLLIKDKHQFILPDYAGFLTHRRNGLFRLTEKIIPFRNRYAHGATPKESICQKDYENYKNYLDLFLICPGLEDIQIFVPTKKTNHNYTMIKAYSNKKEEAQITSDEDLFIDHVYLCFNKSHLDLFPIILYRTCNQREGKRICGEKKFFFYNDHKKREAVTLLNYPTSHFSIDREITKEFYRFIPISEWAPKITTDFRERVEELTENFKGRELEKEEIVGFFNEKKKGFFLLLGPPGIGKSALVAEVFKNLSREYQIRNDQRLESLECVEYFIRRGSRFENPNYFLRYINNKLEEKFRIGIPGAQSRSTDQELYEDLHTRLRRISSQLENHKKLLIFIDGLDEGVGEIGNILDYLPKETYNNIYIYYTSRPIKQIDNFYQALPIDFRKRFHLKGLSNDDIRALLYGVTNKYRLEEQFIDEIAKRSEGNPLYITLLCNALAEGYSSINDIQGLPLSLQEFYRGILNRFSAHKEYNKILKILYVLTAASEYLSFYELDSICGFEDGESEKLIQVLQEVLIENPETEVEDYQLFHESLRDYLKQNEPQRFIDAECLILAGSLHGEEVSFENLKELISSSIDGQSFELSSSSRERIMILVTSSNESYSSWEILKKYLLGFKNRIEILKFLYKTEDPLLCSMSFQLASSIQSENYNEFLHVLDELLKVSRQDLGLINFMINQFFQANIDFLQKEKIVPKISECLNKEAKSSFIFFRKRRQVFFQQAINSISFLAKSPETLPFLVQIVKNVIEFDEENKDTKNKLVEVLGSLLFEKPTREFLIYLRAFAEKKKIFLGSEDSKTIAKRFIAAVLFNSGFYLKFFKFFLMVVKNRKFKQILSFLYFNFPKLVIARELFQKALIFVFAGAKGGEDLGHISESLEILEGMLKELLSKELDGISLFDRLMTEFGESRSDSEKADFVQSLMFLLILNYSTLAHDLFSYTHIGLDYVASYNKNDRLSISKLLCALDASSDVEASDWVRIIDFYFEKDTVRNYCGMLITIIHGVKDFSNVEKILSDVFFTPLEDMEYIAINKQTQKYKIYREVISIFSYLIRRETKIKEIERKVEFLWKKLCYIFNEVKDREDLAQIFLKHQLFDNRDPLNLLLPLGIAYGLEIKNLTGDKDYFCQSIEFFINLYKERKDRQNLELAKKAFSECLPVSYFSPRYVIHLLFTFLKKEEDTPEIRRIILEILFILGMIYPQEILDIMKEYKDKFERSYLLEIQNKVFLQRKRLTKEDFDTIHEIFYSTNVFGWHEIASTIFLYIPRMADVLIKTLQEELIQDKSAVQVGEKLLVNFVLKYLEPDVGGDIRRMVI